MARKTSQPFGEYVRGLDLDPASNLTSARAAIPLAEMKLSDLVAGTYDDEVETRRKTSAKIETFTDFTAGMLDAVKELNQNPELLNEVSKRIS